MRLYWLFSIGILLFILGCEKEETQVDDQDGEWLIPKDKVRDGGPGKDGIPSVDDPNFINKESADFLEPSDLVIGIIQNGTAKAYGHPVLDHHEIVNDKVGGKPISMTYCPLTGTGIAISRKINGSVTTFGVSGLLYNNNLIPYDRKTESNWSQMQMRSVNGELSGKSNETFQVVETPWSTWKAMYPETQVLSRETEFSRNYERYPYGNYKNNDQLLFPVSNKDDRLPRKERVHGVIRDDRAKVYRFKAFKDSTNVIEERFAGQSLILAGNKAKNFIVSFNRPKNLADSVAFSGLNNALPNIMKDDQGNHYNVFGQVTEGPDKGTRLKPTQSYMGYWFAWAAFFPDVKIYSN